jgi:DNA-binding SARP family transcriptional activator
MTAVAAHGVQFRVLGSVAVYHDDRPLGPPVRPQQYLVLTALLVDVGQPVAVERLIERVWGEEPPPQARRTLQTHVARIRRLLGEGVPLLRHDGAYRLDADPLDVDLHRFRALATQARDAARTADEQVELWREALELWHGQALAGLAGDWAARTREHLALERAEATVAWADAQIRRGRADEVVGPLSRLTSEHPLMEPAAAALIRALAATARPAEALDTYAQVRQRLIDDLGADPGPQLQALHHDLLNPSAVTAPAPPPVTDPHGAELGPQSSQPAEVLVAVPRTPRRRAAAAVIAGLVLLLLGAATTGAALSAAHRDVSPSGAVSGRSTTLATSPTPVNVNCYRAAPPPGTDLLTVPHAHPEGDAKMNDWWANNDHIEMGPYGIHTFTATVREGSPNIWDLVIVRSCLPVAAGQRYRLRLTARADAPVTVRVRVQEPEGAVMSFSTDLRLGPQPQRLDVPIVAHATSRQDELLFMVGGHPTDYDLQVTDISLTGKAVLSGDVTARTTVW